MAFLGSLDANVILRLLLQDVPTQHQAATKLLLSGRGQFAVADTAIIEVVFVLERNYGFTRAQVSEAIKGLMALPQINCNRTLFVKALPLFEEHSGLSFEDCCLAIYAELNDATTLWTFDKKLASQAPAAQLLAMR
jgi:predicted nucleic-acid-binding protein